MKDPRCPWGGCKTQKVNFKEGPPVWVCSIHLCEIRKVGKEYNEVKVK